MIDWGVSGVYPPGFEQAVFQARSGRYKEFSEMVLARLSDLHERVTEQFANIGYGLSLAARH
jgi:hypothetical protein